MIVERHISPRANQIIALTEELNPCVIVLRVVKYRVTSVETSIDGRDEKYVYILKMEAE
jgi:hypothetical protein